jgi:dUTP pyrophosphatase
VAPRVEVRRLRAGAVVPRYMSAGAAGMDLSAAVDAPLSLAPGARAAIPTGLAVAIPEGYEGQIRPRSGRALREGLSVPNAPGTIDADYRGELLVLLVNLGDAPIEIRAGDRIAQLVIAPVARVSIVEVDDLPATARGPAGIGSTG